MEINDLREFGRLVFVTRLLPQENTAPQAAPKTRPEGTVPRRGAEVAEMK